MWCDLCSDHATVLIIIELVSWMDVHIEVNLNLIRNGVQALQHNVIENTLVSALHSWRESTHMYKDVYTY